MTIRRVHIIVTSGGPSLYYRLLLPLRHLNPLRYQVTWMCPDLKDLRPGDIVIGQNVDDSEFWSLACARPDVMTVYDLDLDSGIQRTLSKGAALAKADLLTVPNQATAQLKGDLRVPVEVIPNCPAPDWIGNVTVRTYDHLTVGWASLVPGGAEWQSLGLKLKSYARREPRARFRAMGRDPFAPHVSAAVRSWQDNSDARWGELEFDIGLAPLADTPENQFRSWTQVMEYSAKGIVPIASPVGQAAEWIDHGVDGFLAETPDQWLEFLLKLSDDQFREKVSCAAMSRAEEWTVDKMIFMWESAYERGS